MEKALRLNAEQREDLVAYLDGELPESETQHIDQVLARSEVARHEVEALARTWELLDLLAKPNARDDFATRTLTSLKLSEVQTPMADQPWFSYVRKGAAAVVWVAALALFGVGGFLLTTRAIPNPNVNLLTHLPMVRNLDLYLALSDFEFVDELRRQSLFVPPAGKMDDGASVNARPLVPKAIEGVPAKELNQRFDAVARASETERDLIRRNWETWGQLSPERQAQMQELHRRIAQEPPEVHAMLETYGLWLQTLSLGQREDLRQAGNSGVRVELVRKFKSQQDVQNEKRLFELRLDSRDPRMPKPPAPPLTSEEFSAVMAAARQQLPAIDRPGIEAMPPGLERQVETVRSLVIGVRDKRIDESTVDRIVDAIPNDQEKTRIQRLPKKEDRQRELLRLIGWQMFGELRKELPTDEDLQEFFLSDKVTSEQRFTLMQMNRFELKRELERLFLAQTDNRTFQRADMIRWKMMEAIFNGPRAPFGSERGPFGPGGRGFPDGRGPDNRFGPRPGRPNDGDGPRPDRADDREQPARERPPSRNPPPREPQ